MVAPTLTALMHALAAPHVVTFADALGWAILVAGTAVAAVLVLVCVGAVVLTVAYRMGWISPRYTESTGPR